VSFKSNLPQVTAAIEAAGRASMIGGIEKMRGMVVKNIKQQGHGKEYPLPGSKTGGTYTASAPSEYPAVRLGILSGPGGVETETESNSGAWEARIGSRYKFGLALEKKPVTRGGRPWLKRTLDENKDAIVKGFEDTFNAEIKRQGA